MQREWWNHRSGCGDWFVAERDTRTNEVIFTALPQDVFGEGATGIAGAAAGGANGGGAAGGHGV